MDENHGARPHNRPSLTAVLAAFKLVRAGRKHYREQLDRGELLAGVGVALNARSEAILDRAENLAEEVRRAGTPKTEEGAVAELSRMAAGYEYDLRVAIAQLRLWARDSRQSDYARRLAEAALVGGPRRRRCRPGES